MPTTEFQSLSRDSEGSSSVVRKDLAVSSSISFNLLVEILKVQAPVHFVLHRRYNGFNLLVEILKVQAIAPVTSAISAEVFQSLSRDSEGSSEATALQKAIDYEVSIS